MSRAIREARIRNAITTSMRQQAINLIREVQVYFDLPFQIWLTPQKPLVFSFGAHTATFTSEAELEISTIGTSRGVPSLTQRDIQPFLNALKIAISDRIEPLTPKDQKRRR